ncbi:hypothetical protein DSO57_1020327 [Entomophthora muscae]|uniref:Uncharacterized protein n=1 Tax=Entomophthora muscae TaxID=34485 RepID=A0ACC2SGQ0_9FUNG|nr:hypothetical protein DSO57_1020327 [Entomophthora muscae]
MTSIGKEFLGKGFKRRFQGWYWPKEGRTPAEVMAYGEGARLAPGIEPGHVLVPEELEHHKLLDLLRAAEALDVYVGWISSLILVGANHKLLVLGMNNRKVGTACKRQP